VLAISIFQHAIIMARRADDRVQLLTRKGYNFSNRFPQIVAALTVRG
jgi:ATP-dependent DNA ligase